MVKRSRGFKRTFVIGVAAVFIFAGMPGNGSAQPFVKDELLVQYKAGVTGKKMDEVASGAGASVVNEIPRIRVKRIRVPAGGMEKVRAALAKNPHVAFVEPDFVGQASGTPNDSRYPSQWHFPMIWAPQGWDVSTGSAAVPIAVIDSGVDAAHPDLAGKVLPGWNFIGGNSDTSDVLGHGTAVAGTAAAVTNNGTGVSGLAWQNPVMPLVVLSSSNYATYSNIASAIIYAVDRGVRVINISIGGSSSSYTLQNAVNYAWSKGALIFASAMNNGNSTPYYPAACANVIAVTATTSSETRASFSSYGDWVDMAAPGASIFTTSKGGGYGSWSGTSFASPLSAGLAALVLSVNPALTNAEVEAVIKQNADDLGASGFDPYFGHGRINVYYTLLAAQIAAPAPDTTVPTVDILSPTAGATVSGIAAVSVAAEDNVGVTKAELYIDGVFHSVSSTTPASFAWDTTGVANGLHDLLAVAYDEAGNVGESGRVTVTVSNTSDATPPSVRILVPYDGAYVYSRAVIAVNATDNTAVNRIELYIDGALERTTSGSSLNYTWNSRKAAYGAHTITAKAYDDAGNVSAKTVTVYKY